MDFEIIWKHIHGISTPEEEDALNIWLEEDPKNRMFYDGALNHSTANEKQGQEFRQTELAWKKLNKRIDIRRKVVNTIAGITAVAAIFVLAVFVINPFNKTQTVETVAARENIIEPGSSKARLILEDGTQYNLGEKNNLSLEKENVVIKSKGNGIKYHPVKSGKADALVYNTIDIPRGGEFFMVLSDGTKVWLNSETVLKYPVRFVGDRREVELTGEAYFEVARNEKKPFTVISGSNVTEVLGTSFNVSSYPEEDLILTTLVEGRLKVFCKEDPSIQEILNPQQQSCFSKKDQDMTKRTVDVELYTSWKEGLFTFEDQKLIDIMNTLSRWYDIDVGFADPQVGDIHFSGTTKRYEDFEMILKLIQQTNEIAYSINDKKVEIR